MAHVSDGAPVPRPKVNHPPISQMVTAAVENLKEKGGSSLYAIKKYLAANYNLDAEKLSPFIKRYLKSAVDTGTLIQTKGRGAIGSFKLGSSTKVKKATKKKEKLDTNVQVKPTKISKDKKKKKPPFDDENGDKESKLSAAKKNSKSSASTEKKLKSAKKITEGKKKQDKIKEKDTPPMKVTIKEKDTSPLKATKEPVLKAKPKNRKKSVNLNVSTPTIVKPSKQKKIKTGVKQKTVEKPKVNK